MAAATQPEPCVFCDIVAGRVESSQVYSDGHVIAFMDIRPLTPGHLLVVPRVHADGLEALPDDLGARVFTVAHQLGRALRISDLPCAGVNMFLADGVAAGQEVFHVHLHVIPRNPGDGFRLKARPRTPGRGDLEASAERVRQAIGVLPQWPPGS
jgi:diadenosine tetraphosphate (Ap4A) HIT family hydrolase